jgi:hypothetical protein
MRVIECDVPASSALSRDLIRSAYFHDSYRAPLARPGHNKHLDFRLSVLRVKDADAGSVVVSTICSVHNIYGKIYLFFIVPFHRTGVKSLMSNAVAAKRL